MIKTVIKRDGSQEPWAVKKPAQWQEWGTRGKVPFGPLFERVVSRLREVETSRDIQLAFIDEFLALKTWEGNCAAGRLYATVIAKDFYPNGIPTIEQLHNEMQERGFMRSLGYTPEEYAEVEKIIDHQLDFELAHYQVKQITEKYCLQDRSLKLRFESPQFVDMRLAMAMAEHEVGDKKIEEVRQFYHHFATNKVNNPTPNYMYIGTRRSSSPSCCLYVIPDNVSGIAAAHHICEMMASAGAGLGEVVKLRSAGDDIRGGELVHFGKKRYLDSHSKLAIENTAAGRSGALNTGVSVYDPDFVYMAMLQNPRTPISARNRNTHVTMQDNPTFARRVARDETITPWNTYTAPHLWDIWVSGDDMAFEEAYAEWEAQNPQIQRVKARDVLLRWKNQWNQVGTVYGLDLCEINRHSPHRDPINCTNLCTEIALPTHEYDNVDQLYKKEYFGEASIVVSDQGSIKTVPVDMGKLYTKQRHGLRRNVEGYCLLPDDIVSIEGREMRIVDTNIPRQPETALCNLSGVIVSNMIDHKTLAYATDEEYLAACLVALKSIWYTIHSTTYKLHHIGWTAKKRMNAGVGVVGLATVMARKGLRYDTRAGLSEIHRIAERHMYFLIKASIQLGRERGNAEWIDRTKWVDGWTPLDTYNRGIDKYHDAELVYDWKALSQELIDNGGMAFSTLFTIPPSESSSKKSGPPNAIYPIRQMNMKKSDASNVLDWTAPFAEELKWDYQSAFDIAPVDHILHYGVWNKFTDHTVSCDQYRDRRHSLELSSDALITEYLLMKEVGQPTHYYGNSRTAEEDEGSSGAAVCGSEGCTL